MRAGWRRVGARNLFVILVAAVTLGATEPDSEPGDQGMRESDWELGLRAYEAVNFPLAYKMFLPFARAGNTRAQTMIGNILSSIVDGPTDYVAAAAWYKKAVRWGDDEAMLGLSELYSFGMGVAPDRAKALDLIRNAADAGNDEAQRLVGIMYFGGTTGRVERDRDEGLRWYRMSAFQGNDHAIARMADIYANRRAERMQRSFPLGAEYNNGRGVPKDNWEAALWLRVLAEQGHRDARAWLARMYENGFGVPKSDSAARAWAGDLAPVEIPAEKLGD